MKTYQVPTHALQSKQGSLLLMKIGFIDQKIISCKNNYIPRLQSHPYNTTYFSLIIFSGQVSYQEPFFEIPEKSVVAKN